MTQRYHHGDLPNAVRAAAVDVIVEHGLGAFSLREVARRAGVSHTAPAHHFGDVRGLLTSLAIEGFEVLAASTQAAAATASDPVTALSAMGEAYVALATDRPAHCQVMFRVDVVDAEDPRLLEAGMRAFGILHDAMARIIETEGLAADVDLAVELCWSTMQGLIVLEPKLAFIDAVAGRPSITTADRVTRMTALMLDGIRHTTATTA